MDMISVFLGSIAFAIFWVLSVFPTVPILPIGRTAGSLLGTILMVVFKVMTPDDVYDAIDLPIIGLLFGTMIVSSYLERADMFKHLGKLLSWNCFGPKDLICRICLISAISSALFTNDTTCVILTEFVLKIASQHNLPPLPFLLALATSANIGSAATPIGNPQNLVIAGKSKMSFRNFLTGILPAVLLGLVINALILLCMYWRLLSNAYALSNSKVEPKAIMVTVTADGNFEMAVRNEERMRAAKSDDMDTMWKRTMWKPCVYLVTLGMVISFLMGFNMSWTAITAALVLVILDFRDAQPCLEKVSYPLLIFFCGMFATVAGFKRTGIPCILWDLVEPHAKSNTVFGTTILAFVILGLSNLASNVPAVLLLGGPVAQSALAISSDQEKKAWLIIAWVSTVAGNVSLMGSAANLIVCEQARLAPFGLGYHLSSWEHLKFGLPSTLIVTAVGLAFM